MNVISGVISRQVLPACGSLCFFCPAMRARSRQPVKRYKKLIADIFPKNQEEGPNDRKIGKLCEYVAKNPLRVPKIADSLEQRCYKELRIENFQSAKIVLCIYRKLLISCKEQIPLFATSLLSIIQTLLDQTRQDEIRLTGCQTLFDFVNNQENGSFMFNVEDFIPKLCQLAQEDGEDKRASILASAALQALSSMVWFMGQHSHISAEFDNVVSVVLDNYGGPPKKKSVDADHEKNRWLQEVEKTEGHVSPSPDVQLRIPSWRAIVNEKGEVNVAMEDAQNPCFWSRVCLHNMVKLGKEATTMRRVLESLFRYFDNCDLWSPEHGLAILVLKDMQILLDNSGQTSHFLLSILVKHLDHKNVLKNPKMQLDIVEVITSLSERAKVEHSVAIVGAVCDIMRHLRRSIHCSLDDSSLGAEVINYNRRFREAVDKCLVQLSGKVGDAGPILDAMSMMLENMSTVTVIARTTIAAIYRTAQVIAPLPNRSCQNKAFPDALLHQLLPAMVHPDHETRVGAHRIFSIVLVPSSVCPTPSLVNGQLKKDIIRTLSRSVSAFSSSAALFAKLKNEKFSSKENTKQIIKHSGAREEEVNTNTGLLGRLKSTYSRAYSSNNLIVPPTIDENSVCDSSLEPEATSLRLSSHQITLLLSSIWAQSISPANTPENYEAMAHTYSLVLLFSRAKNSSHEALIRSFQMALSLRDISLIDGGPLPPSRRRSLFMLATSMILFSSQAFNVLALVSNTKLALAGKTVDPFLHLIEERKLQAVKPVQHPTLVYGSREDDKLALKSLSEIQIPEDQTRGFFASEIVKSLESLSNSEMSNMREQLLTEFLPDDVCPLGIQFFMADPHKIYLSDSKTDAFNKEHGPLFSVDDDAFADSTETQIKNSSQQDLETPYLLSVNQLLESVLETAHQVARMSTSTAPDVSYKEMAGHCETLLMGKQQKMSHLMSVQMRQESLINFSLQTQDTGMALLASHYTDSQRVTNPFLDPNLSFSKMCSTEYQTRPRSFRLPVTSPYDQFLKAAGC